MSGPTPPQEPPHGQPGELPPGYAPPPGYGPPSSPPPTYGQPPSYGQQPPPPSYGQPQGYPQQPGYGAPPGYPQQPGYGPPGYPQQQPPMGPVTTQMARINPGPSYGFGAPAAALAAIGAVLCVVSFTALDWFDNGSDGGKSNFGAIRDVLKAADAEHVASGVAKVYFGWLAWVLLIGTFAAALAAAVPTVGRSFRIVAPFFAGLSIAITFAAIKFLTTSVPSYSEYLKHTRIGFYMALAGFLLMAIGGMVGPRRVPR